MNLNSNIIMSGQQPDVVNTLARSTRAAGLANQVQKDNALSQLYQQHGQGLMSGDPNAINALAAQDPRQAFQFQQGHRDNARQDQMDEMQRQKFDMAVQDFARRASAEERAAAAAELERDITRAGTFYQSGDLEGLNRALVAAGEEPVQSLEQFPVIAGLYGDALATLKSAQALSEEDKPQIESDRNDVKRFVGGEQHGQPVFPEVEDAPAVVDPKAVQDLRKEFNGVPAVKDFSKQAQAFGRIVASAKDPSPAGDLALIFNYMKVLDPGSVVRESEFATAESAAAWLQESEQAGIAVPLPVARAIRKVADGTRLSPEQRDDFVSRGQALYSQAERGFTFIRDQYSGIAERQGIAIEDALIDFRFQPEQPASNTPQPAGEPTLEFESDEQRQIFEKYR